MDLDPWSVNALIAALVGALIVFGLVVVTGARLVRWLALPQELPEGPQYEPPPPALERHPDRARAASVARRQGHLRALFAQAAAIRLAHDETIGWQQALAAYPRALIDGATLARAIAAVDHAVPIAAAADHQADALIAPLRVPATAAAADAQVLAGALDPQARAAQDALAGARAAVEPLPDPTRRRRVILLVVLAALIALWLLAMPLLIPGPGAGSLPVR